MATTILQRAAEHPIVEKVCKEYKHPYLLPAQLLEKIVHVAWQARLLKNDWQNPESIDLNLYQRWSTVTWDQLQRHLAFIESRPKALSDPEIQGNLLFMLEHAANERSCKRDDQLKILLNFFTAHPEILEHDYASSQIGGIISSACIEFNREAPFHLILAFVKAYPKILSSDSFLGKMATALNYAAETAVKSNRKFFNEAFAAIVSLLEEHDLLNNKRFQKDLAIEMEKCQRSVCSERFPEDRFPAQQALYRLQALIRPEHAPSPIWLEYRDQGERVISSIKEALTRLDERLDLEYDAEHKEFIILNSKNIEPEAIEKIFDTFRLSLRPELANRSTLNGNKIFILVSQNQYMYHMIWDY